MSRHVVEVGKPWEGTVKFSLGVVHSGLTLHTAGVTARDSHDRRILVVHPRFMDSSIQGFGIRD